MDAMFQRYGINLFLGILGPTNSFVFRQRISKGYLPVSGRMPYLPSWAAQQEAKALQASATVLSPRKWMRALRPPQSIWKNSIYDGYLKCGHTHRLEAHCPL